MHAKRLRNIFFSFCMLATLLLGGCEGHISPGTYVASKCSSWDYPLMIMYHVTSSAVGTTLKLQPDHAFRLEYCSCVRTGAWQQKDELLYLYIRTNKNKRDSTYIPDKDGNWIKVHQDTILTAINDTIIYHVHHGNLLDISKGGFMAKHGLRYHMSAEYLVRK